MKKTLLALAIPAALVAGSASAATVYENDDTAVKVGGAVEIQYRQTAKEEIANTDGQIRVDDGDLTFDVEHKLNDALTAIGAMHLTVGEDKDDSENASGYASNGKVKQDEIYVGLTGDFGTVTIGTKTPFIDDSGAGVDIELKDNGGTGLVNTDPYDQLLQYTYSQNGLNLGAGYVFTQDSSDSDTGDTAEMYEFLAGYDYGMVQVNAYYTVQNGVSFTDADKDGVRDAGTKYADNEIKAFELDVMANIDALYLGAAISSLDVESYSDNLMSYELAAAYAITEKAKVGLGFAINDADGDNSDPTVTDSQSSIYANVQYKLAKNTRAYAEVSFEDNGKATGDTSGTGVAVGMEVKF